uniref:Uncharacterized protein n=1 Tax=Cryptomonas curvata TaxID=233186 RepID=A0A7S0M986_9CRYP
MMKTIRRKLKSEFGRSCGPRTVTALAKLLPPSCGILFGSWQRCEGGLSGHALYEECVQSKTAGDNDWMPLLKIGEISEKKNARQKEGCGKKICRHEFGFKVSCVNRN